MNDPRVEHAACDRALRKALDDAARLRRKHSLMVTAVEQLRPFEGELLAMRHRGDPVLDRMASLVMLAISTLTYDGEPLPAGRFPGPEPGAGDVGGVGE